MSLIRLRVMVCAFALLISPLLAAEGDSAKVVSRPSTEGRNDYYAGNRAPLLPSPLIRLPLGSVRPSGWLRHQLELMADGFSGRLAGISEFCKIERNAWTSRDGSGHSGWEEVPYWLRGYYDLGYLLNDARILKEANQWLEGVLASQRSDGYFGSQSNLEGDRLANKAPDIWPNMVMLYPLRSLYEATGDKRILAFMTGYFRWQMTVPLEKFIPFSWQNWRAGDNLDSIHWLYNRTGDRFLLELARVNHERTANWVGDVPTWHVVNIAECFRAPAQYYQQTRDLRYLKATERVYDTVRGIYGQVPGGMYGADENARPGFTGPRQGTETCAFVEMMYSGEMLAGITGDVLWADRVEEVAFNSFPASMTPDLKGLHYLTAPNQVQLDRGDKSPWVQNGGNMFAYNPHEFRCCQHNVAFGWPYFAEHAWMATARNGLAAVYYAPNRVSAKVGDGATARITVTTDYPFDDVVDFAVSLDKPARFPLVFRVPGWCQSPEIRLNGQTLKLSGNGSGWIALERAWANGDQIRLRLPMRITATEWTRNRSTVSVNRGPLTYSLKIGERWETKGGTTEWPGRELHPTSAWNYGLVLDMAKPASSFEVTKKSGPLASQPFTLANAPISLRAKGRKIPQWKQEANGIVGEVQPGPVRSSEPTEEITLIPMGCARLRISAFPRISDGGDARIWQEAVPILLASRTSHFKPLVFDARGTQEWFEFRYSAPQRVSRVEITWLEDERERVRPPASSQTLYWDGSAWQPLVAPVSAARLRVEVQLCPGSSAGIQSWEIR